MPLDIRDGERITYSKFCVSYPTRLSELVEEERKIPGTRSKRERGDVLTAALEVYFSALGKLPPGYKFLSAGFEADVARDAVAKSRAEKMTAKKGGRR